MTTLVARDELLRSSIFRLFYFYVFTIVSIKFAVNC